MRDSPPPGADLDLALVRSFTVVAERRHSDEPREALLDYLVPDLTTVPLKGVEPGHVVLATRAGDRGRLVTAFRKCAQAHLAGPQILGEG